MPIFQAFNRRNKAWVKFKLSKKGFKVLDVKQRNPKVPFKGVPKKGQTMKGGKK